MPIHPVKPPAPPPFTRSAAHRFGAGAASLVLVVVLALSLASSAQAATAVGLGTLDSYGVLGGSGVTNTGPTVINGDLGTAPTPTVTGFGGAPNGTVNGAIHQADAAATQAQGDLTTAYNDAAGQGPVNTVATELAGQSLTPGVYGSSSGTFGLTGPVTLNAGGDPNAVFIFQTASTLITGSASSVNLINGAQSCNVFWQVGSSATLGSSSSFVGNILAAQSISVNNGVTVDGRLLARNGAVTLINDTVTRATCAAGGGGNGGGNPGGNGAGGPSIDITGFPPGGPSTSGRCLDRGFMAKIAITDRRRMRSVKVFVEGELIINTTRKRFSVWIAGAGLRSGTNTIKVVAVDVDGRREVDRRDFRRCAPAVPSPDFTG